MAIFIFVLGIFSFITIPKERFASSELDVISIKGGYSGASASSLNNFAVVQIENSLKNITGIKEISTIIKNGNFEIKLDLEDKVDKITTLNEVKDAIIKAKKDLPSDMTEPTTSVLKRERPLIYLALNAKNKSDDEFSNILDEIQNSLTQIDGVSNVNIIGDKSLEININLDEKKINMYKLNTNSIINEIKKLSYMFPVANVEQSGNHIYINADNNKFDKDLWLNTLLKIDNKKVYLSDIADISIEYPSGETIARLNAQNAVLMNIFSESGTDSISIAKEVREFFKLAQQSYKDIEIAILFDESTLVSNRLSIIISNITLGLILVGFSMYVLISKRLSFVIILGIPFSFIIGLLTMQYSGISLNLTSLAAMLMALGIVVDDAIIISENIQRHLDDGKNLKDAVLKGTKEVIMPVFIAAITTIFAFLPMLFLSGRLGMSMKFIPIVVTILIIASLIESFLFLPLHAKHILKANDKVLKWDKTYDIYEKVLHFCIKYKKSFLFFFFITIPIATFFMYYISRFQFFPTRGSTDIIISAKLENSLLLEESDEIVKKYEKVLLENKDKLWIDSFRTTIGSYSDITGSRVTTENSFTLDLELVDFREDNFLENWINPILTLSFDFERKDQRRTKSTAEIRKELRALLSPMLEKEKDVEYNIISRKLGPVKNDIEIRLSGENSQNLLKSMEILKTELKSIKGISDVADNIQVAEDEYRYSVNNYGQSLGLSDASVASSIGNFFMEKDQANTFDDEGIVKIKTKSIHKDNIDSLMSFNIPLNGGKFVAFSEVVDFNIVRNFEKIEKNNGKIFKKVFANVDVKNITATEALDKLEPTIKELKKQKINIEFGGEAENTKQARDDLLKASLVTLFLIFLALLVNFPSYKNALILLSVIPFTIFGALAGHIILGVNLAITSVIGILGLAGVVINDGIVMLDFLQKTTNLDEFYKRAKQRVRPIFITSITTFLGLSSLIFFPTSDAVFLQPIAISLGFGIAWGTLLNLIYVPTLYATLHKLNKRSNL